MLRALVVDNALWKQHIMLDKETGLDPPGGKATSVLGTLEHRIANFGQ